MFDKQLCNYPLEKVLEALGAKRGTVKDMWYSPFRNEDDASLHIDQQKNVWYDHGAGVGCRPGERFAMNFSASNLLQRRVSMTSLTLVPPTPAP